MKDSNDRQSIPMTEEAVFKHLQREQSRSRTRKLDREAVKTFFKHYRELLAQALDEGKTVKDVYLRIDGGGVAGSYKYTAETSGIRLRNGVIEIGRIHAQKNNREACAVTGGVKGHRIRTLS